MQLPSALFIGNKVNSKNLYYETFFSLYLACFKKGSCKFVLDRLYHKDVLIKCLYFLVKFKSQKMLNMASIELF